MAGLGMVLDENTIHELESRTTCIIKYNGINDTGDTDLLINCFGRTPYGWNGTGTGGNRRRSIMYSICHIIGHIIQVIDLEREISRSREA